MKNLIKGNMFHDRRNQVTLDPASPPIATGTAPVKTKEAGARIDTRDASDLAEEIIGALSQEHNNAFREMNDRVEAIQTRQIEAQALVNQQIADVLGRLERGIRLDRDAAVRQNVWGQFVPQVSRDLGDFFIEHTKKDYKLLTRELQTTTGPEGGFLLPEDRSPEIVALLTVYGAARANGLIVPMRNNERVWPTLASSVSVYWILENAAATESAPTFGETTMVAKTLVGLTHASNQLMADADTDLGALLVDLFARAIAQEEDHQFFRGNSGVVATDPFKGWLFEAGVNQVVMPATKTAYTQVTADDMLALTGAVPTAGLGNAKFYLNRTVLDVVRKIKDSQGNYIWSPMAAGAPGTIWGYPYTLVEVMPTVAQSAISTPFVAFGDARNIYLGERQQMDVARSNEFGFNRNQVYIRVTERIAVKVALPTALSRLVTAAA